MLLKLVFLSCLIGISATCEDKISECSLYGFDYICRGDYLPWSRINCRKFCNLCSEGIDCAVCKNVSSPTNCNNTMTCAKGERCYTTSHGIGQDTTFNLGCRSEADCLGSSSLSIVGRSLGTPCSQCCAVDNCNTGLCSAGTQVANGNGNATCADDPAFNCRQFSSVFNICSDVHHAKTVCRKSCGLCDLVDGAWSSWNDWGSCDVTCGTGQLTRARTCTDPAPKHGGLPCSGNGTQIKPCTSSPCPIHGGWSGWNSWSACSNTCSIGTQTRRRKCDNPVPALAGNHCFGDGVDFRACFLRSCVDGGWSGWSTWSTCTKNVKSRTRSCDSPAPSQFGHDCIGNNEELISC